MLYYSTEYCPVLSLCIKSDSIIFHCLPRTSYACTTHRCKKIHHQQENWGFQQNCKWCFVSEKSCLLQFYLKWKLIYNFYSGPMKICKYQLHGCKVETVFVQGIAWAVVPSCTIYNKLGWLAQQLAYIALIEGINDNNLKRFYLTRAWPAHTNFPIFSCQKRKDS